ncbi:TetR/AcrR family transcriptional regulator [Pelagibacterium xiamenense]|uniref:TetR/AcrR family transcriptional regulator n=1 Tax=Pelagibacterium xiamenense TaxID=2901140 RepID=UPI001E64049E|nr:TetR/AcrR family transcriptional regulator [Pelagibacterium xiamenense]MCD7060659.1 TetR/AcrR family transcriptional regulator [Pelagibacterium xiamenense]
MAKNPKFKRRKDARPDEIVEAALEVFARRGYAAARLDDIAARAGVSKGTLYLYFESKESLFEAVVSQSFAPNIEKVRAAIALADGRIGKLLPTLPPVLAHIMESVPVAAIVKMVIGESQNFPNIARSWYEVMVNPVVGLVTQTIADAQAQGEIRPGDPRNYAVQMVGPIFMSFIWNSVMAPVGAEPFDIESLARQHIETIMRGALLDPEAAP